ncbi:MAG: DNA-binding protein [bacterium]|nr:DNA-binding protein [bacterium]
MPNKRKEVVSYPTMSALELGELLGYGKTKSYEIVAQLRSELEAKGCILPNKGLIPREYALERLGGFAKVRKI